MRLCDRCGHDKWDHGPSGEKDCMCGQCMWFVPAKRPGVVDK